MKAEKLVDSMGQALIGRRVYTERVGAYPGGPSTVIDIRPDPNAPAIICTVFHDTWRGENSTGMMGILSAEQLVLIPEEAL